MKKIMLIKKAKIKKSIMKLIRLALYPIVSLKWSIDRRYLPLTGKHKYLYYQIHYRYMERLWSFPNLKTPNSFNEKIQWLKLFNQDEKMVIVSDKLRLKQYVSEVIGDGYCPETIFVWENQDPENIIDGLPNKFVAKTNHDSGGVFIYEGQGINEFKKGLGLLKQRLETPYGINNGEFCYPLIESKIFIEEYLETEGEEIADYKFHCSKGKVLWLHFIANRKTTPCETLLAYGSDELDYSLYFPKSEKTFKKPSNYDEMLRVAEKLSEDFDYVRVDLYSVKNRTYVGEMTCYPQGGFYTGLGQKRISKYFPLNMCYFKNPILSEKINSNSISGLRN